LVSRDVGQENFEGFAPLEDFRERKQAPYTFSHFSCDYSRESTDEFLVLIWMRDLDREMEMIAADREVVNLDEEALAVLVDALFDPPFVREQDVAGFQDQVDWFALR
jgi:hypothetical protein